MPTPETIRPALRAWLVLLAAVLTVLIAGCGDLPTLDQRTVSRALPPDAQTRLGQTLAPLVDAHPDASGIYPLANAHEAFAARVLLARAAERTLDVQYYIWKADTTGILLFDALHDAAERGVRVRLLLDDNNTAGLDLYLTVLDAHDNIEVRLFNPFVQRNWRLLGYLTDFSRLNRRMHNKSFTADSQASIIGGRNVGDEYFGASNDMAFSDLDVMAVGPVSTLVSQDFDRYWASQSSYPLDRLLASASSEDAAAFSAAVQGIEQTAAAKTYLDTVRQSEFVKHLTQGTLPLEWAQTRMISDDPAKGLGLAQPEDMLMARLRNVLEEPSRSLYLVSPYFVPGKQGVEAFSAMAASGVKIRILTNSLEATDVAAVHAGYAKRRKPLLQAGIELYESRKTSEVKDDDKWGTIGSSYSSLHAKTFSVDDEHVFIGSFNFDPRSANLNTEMGFVIHSPALAKQIADTFENQTASMAYQVVLENESQLAWVEQANGGTIKHSEEPGVTFFQHAFVWLVSKLPIEWLL